MLGSAHCEAPHFMRLASIAQFMKLAMC